MNDKKFFISLGVLTILFLFGGVFFVNQKMDYSQTKPESSVLRETTLSVEKTTYEWGKIGLNDGDVAAIFEITNQGNQPLQLSKLITSCMCTTAQLSLAGKQSPIFGMHNKSAYIFEVPPQETAKLKVIFDPAFHGPTGVGSITRQVTLATNDPNQPELKFSLTALVIR